MFRSALYTDGKKEMLQIPHFFSRKFFVVDLFIFLRYSMGEYRAATEVIGVKNAKYGPVLSWSGQRRALMRLKLRRIST